MTPLIQRVGSIIERATCAAVIGGDPAVEDVRAAVREIAAALADDPGAELAPVRAAIAAAGEITIETVSSVTAALSAAWEAVEAGTAAGPGAPAPPDAELEMLLGDPELASMFIAEALDHLSSIEALVLRLEASPDDLTLLNDIFRPFHTIKGNAGALCLGTIQELAHTVENLLDLSRSGRHRLRAAGIEVVLNAVDLLIAQIRDLQQRLSGQRGADWTARQAALVTRVNALIASGEDDPPAQTSGGPQAPAGPQGAAESGRPRGDEAAATVKVDTRKLDNLVDMMGELVIVQSIIQADPALLEAVDERLARHLAQLKRITSDLQRTAMSMRMVPIRPAFQKMARLVRDLTRRSGKQVDLELSGEDTELDRKVVEEIHDPLMHMVRNSVDHGIEPPAARAAAGKRPAGRLSLSAYHEGGDIVIAIADDGAGLNTSRILDKAVAQGLVEPGAQLSEDEIHALIFQPGFSTAERVTEISGRGVGMDVVRRNIEALRGRVDLKSRPGEGTTFEIRLPLTLAIIDGLLLAVGAERFVLPTFSVAESLRPAPEQVHRVQGAPRLVRVRESLLPLVRLADLFGVAGAEADPTRGTVVVIEDRRRRVALLVDRLIGKQEVVIKSLGETFANTRGVAGGAILGDGRIGLILDAPGLVGLNDGAAAA